MELVRVGGDELAIVSESEGVNFAAAVGVEVNSSEDKESIVLRGLEAKAVVGVAACNSDGDVGPT